MLLNLTILTYNVFTGSLLSPNSWTGPGYDLGIDFIRSQYDFNVIHVYVGNRTFTTCGALADDTDVLSNYFYNNVSKNSLVTLFEPGEYSAIKRIVNFNLIRCNNTLAA